MQRALPLACRGSRHIPVQMPTQAALTAVRFSPRMSPVSPEPRPQRLFSADRSTFTGGLRPTQSTDALVGSYFKHLCVISLYTCAGLYMDYLS